MGARCSAAGPAGLGELQRASQALSCCPCPADRVSPDRLPCWRSCSCPRCVRRSRPSSTVGLQRSRHRGHATRTEAAPQQQLPLLLFFFLEVLSEGVILPHISNFTYTNVNIVIHKVRNKTSELLPAVFDLKGTRERLLPPGCRTNQSLLLEPVNPQNHVPSLCAVPAPLSPLPSSGCAGGPGLPDPLSPSSLQDYVLVSCDLQLPARAGEQSTMV